MGSKPIRWANISLLIAVLFLLMATSVVEPSPAISDANATVSTSVMIVRRRVFAYVTCVGSMRNRRVLRSSIERFLKIDTGFAGGAGAATRRDDIPTL